MNTALYPQRGDIVELVEKPDCSVSQYYQLTVGRHYEVREIFGCCVMTNTDDGDTGIYNASRVKVVSRPAPKP